MNYSIAGALVVLVAIAALAFIFRGRLFTGRLPPDPPAGPPASPPPPTRELYVASMGNHSIVGFAIDANGFVASTPSRVIHGPNTGLQNPFAVALGNTNRIWVANLGPLLPGQPPTGATITVYDSDANGNATPIRTITSQAVGSGFAATPSLANPSAIAMRRVPENLFVANDASGRVFEFDLATDDQPTGGFEGSTHPQPTGVAVDSAQCIYVSDATPGSGSIAVFTPTQPGQYINQLTKANPDLRITGVNNPGHLAIGPDRELFVVVRGNFELPTPNAAVYVYAVGATGTAAPIRVISGSNTQLVRPYGVAVDESGQAFVSNGESVLVFAPGASGNVAPSESVSHFEINNAGGVAVR